MTKGEIAIVEVMMCFIMTLCRNW